MKNTIKYKHLFEKALSLLNGEQVKTLYKTLLAEYNDMSPINRKQELDKQSLWLEVEYIRNYIAKGQYDD